jgi:DNA replication and repair protein RecF
MKVRDLQIHSVRNIQHANLTLHPTFNIIYGANGSGKTSLLESIHLLSTGFSFKTRETKPLIRSGDPCLTVFGRLFSEETISIRKNAAGPTQVNLNAQVCNNNSALARFLPCQVFYQDIFQIIDAGPAVRRSLIDWGVFHVKHAYHDVWRQYRHVLKQRNALLRQHPKRKHIVPWDHQLASLATQLHVFRSQYCVDWKQAFEAILPQLSNIECRLEYYRGWREKTDNLEEILTEQFESDCQRQYTQSGPHQADIRITTNDFSAKQGLSRGQQKIILIALKLAQGQLIEKACLYLFDDLTSELDHHHIYSLCECLKSIRGQKIITVLESTKLYDFFRPNDGATFFNLVHGSVFGDVL